MSQCKNRIGDRCRLNGEVCPHLVYDGRCDRADVSSLGRVTFGTAIEVLLATYPDCKSDINGAFRIVMSYGNWRIDDPIESLTYCEAEKVARMMEENYRPNSIGTFLSWVYRIGGNRFRGEWDRRKLVKPTLDRYSYKIPKQKPPELTWEQRHKIDMVRLKQREIALDESKHPVVRLRALKMFATLWQGCWFGTRTDEACRMKWGCIQTLSGIPHYCFVPHKTEEFGNDVCWPICEDAWNEILPFIGLPDQPMVPVEEKYRKKDFDGEAQYQGVKRALGKLFRGIGCNGWAAFYMLRYNDAQRTYRKEGGKAEAAKHGRSEAVGRAHYYNPNDHRLVI